MLKMIKRITVGLLIASGAMYCNANAIKESNSDNKTENLVQDAINNLKSKMTIIIIAHRLSTIKDADIIYMFEKGTVAEKGTYKELISKKGPFYKLNKSGQL